MTRPVGPTLAPGKTADITLLLEGTYPFVSGGVSSWVHQIITGLPDVDFALVFLGGSPETHDRIRYTLPKNVVHLEAHFLSEAVWSDLAPVKLAAARLLLASDGLDDPWLRDALDAANVDPATGEFSGQLAE